MNQPIPHGVLSAVYTMAIDVLSPRLLTMIAMFMMLGLASWVMYEPDYFRLAALAIFGVLVFLPVVGIERRHRQEGDQNV